MTVRRRPVGRPRGKKNVTPRAKKPLSAIQKLRQHVLIELGVDTSDIARAIGTTHQTVSNIFRDEHRSEYESQVIAYLQEKYKLAGMQERDVIDTLVDMLTPMAEEWRTATVITAESLGWSQRSAPVEA